MGFDAREVVMAAIRQTETYLQRVHEQSLQTRDTETVWRKNAHRFNRVLHKFNLHITTYRNIRELEKLRRHPRGAWLCIGTLNLAYKSPSHFEQLYDLLDDEESKRCLEWVLSYRTAYAVAAALASEIFPPQYSDDAYREATKRLSGEGIYDLLGVRPGVADFELAHTFVFEQYSLPSRVEVEKGDVVLDIGAFIGDTSLWFAMAGAELVYAFEPDPVNLSHLRKVARRSDYGRRIVEVGCAVGSKPGRASFAAVHTGSSAVSTSGVEVEVTTIDDFVESRRLEKVDFIKMDIEGFELEALQGAVNTITKFKPKLAVSVYHKPEDLYQIPSLLKQLLPEARYYLDHRSPHWGETLLFVNPRKD